MKLFKEKDKAIEFDVDTSRLMSIYEKLINIAMKLSSDTHAAIIDGKDSKTICDSTRAILDDHPVMHLMQQFANQYVFCRRKYGQKFLYRISPIYIKAWREHTELFLAGTAKEKAVYGPRFVIECRLVTLLSQTSECPEMDETWNYMSKIVIAGPNF